eukprot:334449_1
MYISLLGTAWFARFFYSTNLIVIVKFIWIEYTQCKRNHDYSWLAAFRILTIVSCAILAILRISAYVPVICHPTIKLIATFSGAKNIFLTFYQITRLKHSFSREHLNESQYKKYGYNKHVNDIPHFGCKWISNTKQGQVLVAVWGIWYFCWDFSVLIMYIVRVIQLNKAIILDNKAIVYHKIKAILKKMILLTICYELAAIAALVIIFVDMKTRYTIHGIILLSMEIVVPVLVIYFMSDHNNDRYLMLLHMFEKICGCCSSTEQNDNSLEMVKHKHKHDETGDDDDIDMSPKAIMNQGSGPRSIPRGDDDNKTNTVNYTDTTNTKTNNTNTKSVEVSAEAYDLGITDMWSQCGEREQMHIYLCTSLFVCQFSVFVIVLVVLLNHIDRYQ